MYQNAKKQWHHYDLHFYAFYSSSIIQMDGFNALFPYRFPDLHVD